MTKNPTYDVLQQHTIYQVITGSTSYGLTTSESDIDQKAIVLLPPSYLFQLSKEWGTETYHNPDIEFHSLKKMIHLLSTQNPTMLETLFVDAQFIVKQNRYGEMLRENRNLFITKNCYYSFGGYARDQLMRLKNGLAKATKNDHDSHLLDIMNRIKQQLMDKYPEMSKDHLNINRVYYENNDKHNVDISVAIEHMPITRVNGIISEMASSLKSYNKVTSRSKKPKVKLYKHAMHLIRLLLMGIEVLNTGKLTVYRKQDRDFLLEIRNEQHSWDKIFTYADNLFRELENAKEKSRLPNHVDEQALNDLYYNIMSDYYLI